MAVAVVLAAAAGLYLGIHLNGLLGVTISPQPPANGVASASSAASAHSGSGAGALSNGGSAGRTPGSASVPPAPAPKIIPEVLPDFSLHDLEGNLRSIRSWPGKSLIVNFWATWCAPCRQEIPLLIRTQNRGAADGFQIVGVAVDFRDAVLDYDRAMKIDYPVLIGEQDGLDAVNAFGVEAVGFPFTVFTDNRGRIIALHLGELRAPLLDGIIAAITRVNRGELTPAEARVAINKL